MAIPAASLADSCAIALAQRVNGTIVTADRPGFPPDRLEAVCPVRFIR